MNARGYRTGRELRPRTVAGFTGHVHRFYAGDEALPRLCLESKDALRSIDGATREERAD